LNASPLENWASWRSLIVADLASSANSGRPSARTGSVSSVSR